MRFLILLPLIAFAGRKECELRVPRGEIKSFQVPLGAAGTLILPEDYKYVVLGNSKDYSVSPIEGESKGIVVMAKSNLVGSTSLTIGMKRGEAITIWLEPKSKSSGCLFTRIKRGY